MLAHEPSGLSGFKPLSRAVWEAAEGVGVDLLSSRALVEPSRVLPWFIPPYF